MQIDDPVSLSRAARTELQAARALAALEAEISLGERPEDWYDQADEALAQIHTHWPRAHLRDAYRESPSLSPRARSGLRTPPLNDAEELSRRHRHRALQLTAVLVVIAAVAWRVARKRPHHLVAVGFVAVMLGWRVAAAIAMAGALIVPLVRARKALGTGSSGRGGGQATRAAFAAFRASKRPESPPDPTLFSADRYRQACDHNTCRIWVSEIRRVLSEFRHPNPTALGTGSSGRGGVGVPPARPKARMARLPAPRTPKLPPAPRIGGGRR